MVLIESATTANLDVRVQSPRIVRALPSEIIVNVVVTGQVQIMAVHVSVY
jgi:hypothetical protein